MAFRPITLHPNRDPWDQQPGETPKLHARFVTYRDEIDHPRKYRMVAERYGVSLQTIEKQAVAHRWQDRAAAFDENESRIRRERIRMKAAKLSDRQMDIALGMVQAVGQSVHYVLQNRLMLEAADAAKWLDIATKVAKIAEGQPERTLAVTGKDGGPIEIEEFQGLSPEQQRLRAQEMAQGVLRLYEGGKAS